MTRNRDLLSTIRDIVLTTTKFMRHYVGEVIDTADPKRSGRVKVAIPQLGWTSSAAAAWCWPRQGHGMSVPKRGEWVEVWFINGDPSWPVFLGIASEMKDMVVEGDPMTHVLFAPAVDSDDRVEYDEAGKVLKLFGDSKEFVTHAELDSALQSMVSGLNSNFSLHMHPTAAVGPPSPPSSGLSASIDISSAKATKVKTG